MSKPRTKYLVKAGEEFVCHCKCEKALVSNPTLVQMDCPWCGCGWLFCCMDCGKPFSFARVELVDSSLEELAKRNLIAFGVEATTEAVVAWVELMRMLTENLDVGQELVYLDGTLVPVTESDFEFEGIHKTHRFHNVPHLDVLNGRTTVDQVLGSLDYWGTDPEERDEE